MAQLLLQIRTVLEGRPKVPTAAAAGAAVCHHSGVADPDAVSLTAEGRSQAIAAGRALHGVEVDRVVTSGLYRTEETARLGWPRAAARARIRSRGRTCTSSSRVARTTACVNILDLDDRPEGTEWQLRAVDVLPYDPVPTGPRLSTVEHC